MSDPETFEFGLNTFGDVSTDDEGNPISQAQTLRNVVEQAVLADELGVDVIGLGEHHRPDFAISAPEMVLGAIAGRTKNIKLSSAVTVLSSDEPVRVFQRFATLDAVSDGRAEIMVGRGSFTESFPLFGYSLDDYEVLFEEKFDLFMKLLDEGPVYWEGTVRAPLVNADVFPKTESGRLKTWLAVGGSPHSVLRAASNGLPLMLAIIGGSPSRFLPFVELYKRALAELGASPLPVAVHSPGFIAETDEEAREIFFPNHKLVHDRIGAIRGWPPMTREDFDHEVDHGAKFVGSPETVARKIANTVKTLGIDRFDLLYASGPIPHSKLMSSIELYGTKVIPRVRELLAE